MRRRPIRDQMLFSGRSRGCPAGYYWDGVQCRPDWADPMSTIARSNPSGMASGICPPFPGYNWNAEQSAIRSLPHFDNKGDYAEAIDTIYFSLYSGAPKIPQGWESIPACKPWVDTWLRLYELGKRWGKYDPPQAPPTPTTPPQPPPAQPSPAPSLGPIFGIVGQGIRRGLGRIVNPAHRAMKTMHWWWR